MRSKRVLLLLVPLLGFGIYRLGQRSRADNAAAAALAAMVERSFAPSWSPNELAVSSLEEKLKKEPGNAKANAALGQAYLQRVRESGDPEYYTKAEALFERALKADAQSIDGLLGKASLLMSRHHFREAERVAREAIQSSPDVVSTYGIQTDALVELGEYEEAIRTLGIMIAKKPNLSSYSRVSYIRELMGDTEGAIQSMQMAIDSGSPHAENTAWCMVQLGLLYLNSGAEKKADEQFHLALTRFPEYGPAFAGLAKLAAARNDFGLAVRYYKHAMDQVPLAEYAIGLGEAYERMGNSDEARSQFELVDAIQKLYESKGVSLEIEMALFNADRGRNIEQALALAKTEWQARKSVRVADVYAWTLYRAGQYEEARQMMKQALRLGTKDPLFLRHAKVIANAKGSNILGGPHDRPSWPGGVDATSREISRSFL